MQQEDDEVASDEAATSEVEKNSGEEADSIGLSDGGDERSLTESHYIPSWAKGVVKTIKATTINQCRSHVQAPNDRSQHESEAFQDD